MKKILGAILCMAIFATGAMGAATTYTNAVDDNWTSAGNWSLGNVPLISADDDVQISGNYTIGLAGTTGEGRAINVGFDADSDLIVTNGALKVGDDNFDVASGSNSTAKVYLTDLEKTSNKSNDHIDIADGDDSTGILTIDSALSGTLNTTQLKVANGDRSTATLMAANSTVDTKRHVYIALGDNSSASVTLKNLGMIGTRNDHLDVATGASSAGTLTIEQANVVAGAASVMNIGTGSNSVGTFSMDSGVITVADLMAIGSTNTDFNATGTLTLNGGIITAGDVLIGGGSTINLTNGLLVVANSNSMTMASGSSLVMGMGTLVWSNGTAAATMDGWVTGGLVSTNDGFGQAVSAFTGSVDYDFTYGTGDTRLFINEDGTTTQMWAETIPEPATIGMIIVFGSGLFFIRRRKRT